MSPLLYQRALWSETGVCRGEKEGTPDEVLNPKKKVWEKLSVDLKTNSEDLPQWNGSNLVTGKERSLRLVKELPSDSGP